MVYSTKVGSILYVLLLFFFSPTISLLLSVVLHGIAGVSGDSLSVVVAFVS